MIAWMLCEDIKNVEISNTLDTKQLKGLLDCEELDRYCIIDHEHDRSYIISI